jgi:DNA-binding CsgD family transcriptional regulator/tetratricopeptide (TPR) repeat protein
MVLAMIGDVTRRVTSPEFIGRADELDLLQRALAETADAHASHILIAGEAGVGKSRLVAEISRKAREVGWQVLAGGCLDMGEGGLPFGPYADLLRSWARDSGRAEALAFAGTAAMDLGRLVPELRPRDAAPTQDRWVQARIHDALFDLLARLSTRSPVLVVLEDIHWADADTLAATSSILRAVRNERVALLMTYRGDELHRRHPLRQWLAEVGRSIRPTRLELEPFDAREVARLIEGVLGTVPGDELVASLHRRSDGNPFFAEELLASGQAEGGHGLSPTLRDLLATRIAGVSDPARLVLGIVAVAGHALSHQLLLTIGRDHLADPHAALREVIEAGLLVTATSDGDDGYAFRHALVHEAAYADLLPGERRALHRDFALAMEADGGRASAGAGRAVEIAHHWRSARDLARGLGASIRAGDASSEAYAFAQSLAEYEHALVIWDQLTEPERAAGIDRVELLARTARSAHLVSSDRRAVAWLREAVELTRSTGDGTRTGVLLEQLGRVLWVSGDAISAVTVSEEAVAAIPADTPSAERARALSGLAQVLMLDGYYGRSRDLCLEAVTIARAAGARAPEGHALNTLGIDLAHLGESDAAIEALEQALAIGWEVRNADDIARAFVNLSDSLWLVGDVTAALRRVEEGLRAAIELGVESVYGYYLRMNGVFFAWEAGDWTTAARLYREAMVRAPDGGGAERYRLAYAIDWLVASGAEEAEASWAMAWDLIATDPSAATTGPPPHCAGVELRLWQGRAAEALVIAEDGLRRLSGDPSPLRLMVHRMAARATVDAALATGMQEAMAAGLARLHALREEASGIQRELKAPGGRAVERMALEIATIDAEATRLGDRPSAATWSALRQGWAAWGHPYHAAYAGARLAIAAASEGDTDAAEPALLDAHAIALELGARPMMAWLEDIGRQLGFRLRAGPGDRTLASSEGGQGQRPFGLSARELEVLLLVAAGRTNRQIGEELFISPNTAGVHVSNILGKLGVTSRTEAASAAFQSGLVSAERSGLPDG